MRRAAHLALACLVSAALFADCLAGDRPILMSKGDTLQVFASAQDADGTALRGEALSASLGPEDWALWPLIRRDPVSVRTRGRIEVLQSPSAAHWLGSDDRGRDVASRLIHGTRLSLQLAFLCALLATVVGLLLALGAVSRRRLDASVITVCDTIAAIPALLLVLVVRGLTGGQSMAALVLLIGIPRAATTARVVRDGLHSALAKPYCEAARAVGCSRWRLLLGHALPQCWPQLRVAAALTASTAVLAEVALSFLGLGIAGPAPSWGELLRQAHENGLRWWLLVPAGVATTLLAWALGRVARDD